MCEQYEMSKCLCDSVLRQLTEVGEQLKDCMFVVVAMDFIYVTYVN